MSRFVALFLMLASTIGLELDLSKSNEQYANGSTSFTYFSSKAKEVADSLLQYRVEVDNALEDYINDLKTNNNASLTLERYNEAVESVEGTSCAVSAENKTEPSGAQIVIEAIITTCAENIPGEFRAALDKKIAEYLKKVQAIDNTLRLNRNLCSSLRATLPPSCVEAEERALARLKDLQSYGEKAKLSYYSRTAFFACTESVDACVQGATKTLQDDLKAKIDEIDACISTLQ